MILYCLIDYECYNGHIHIIVLHISTLGKRKLKLGLFLHFRLIISIAARFKTPARNLERRNGDLDDTLMKQSKRWLDRPMSSGIH